MAQEAVTATLSNDVYDCDVLGTVSPGPDDEWGFQIEPIDAQSALHLEISLEVFLGPWEFSIAGLTVPVAVHRGEGSLYRLTKPTSDRTSTI